MAEQSAYPPALTSPLWACSSMVEREAYTFVVPGSSPGMPNSVKAKSGAVPLRFLVRVQADAKRKIFMEKIKQKEMTLEDLEKEIGFYIEAVNDYSTEDQVEWYNNFSKNLSEIQKILESENANKVFKANEKASILEIAISKLNTLMANIKEVRKDLSGQDYQTVRKLLLIDLKNLLN